MPARARMYGAARVRSRSLNKTRPPRGRSKPLMLFRRVVLPTPLRPMRQTTCPGPTSRSTSRKICVSPYDTCSCSMRSIGFAILSEIDLNNAGVTLHLLHGPLAEDLSLVQHGDLAGDLPHEGHVVIDNQEGALARHGEQ